MALEFEQRDHRSISTATTTDHPTMEWDVGMIVVRMATGVKKHFHIRATEWVMLYPSVILGYLLTQEPPMFSVNPAVFGTLARWANESTWAILVLMCAALRFGALAVNGTFQGFGLSPHLRLTASAFGAAFWSQFGLGFTISAIYGGSTWLLPLLLSTFCFVEVLNISRSWTDIICRKR